MGIIWLRTTWPVCLVWNPLERLSDAVGLTPHVVRAWDAAGWALRTAVELLPEMPRLRLRRKA
jgi:hypothetical protein